MSRYTLRVLEPIPHFRCVPGDALVFELGGTCIWHVHQPADDPSLSMVTRLPPNWGFLAGCLDQVEVLTPGVEASALRQVIGSDLSPPPTHRPPPVRPAHLRLVQAE